jgi:gentisate 1,2-dioxygenase
MSRGDLIFTPTGLWHEHGHDGTEPVIWLGCAGFAFGLLHGSVLPREWRQTNRSARAEATSNTRMAAWCLAKCLSAAKRLIPCCAMRGPMPKPYCKPWLQDEQGLEQVQVTYTNPETGADAQNILGFYALMLRPGQTLRLPARSPAQVFHVIEGAVQADIVNSSFHMVEADTCCAPGYEAVTLKTSTPTKLRSVFIADESPLHRKLGVYESRG